ncbi:MAG: SH3 domain-containing protein [Tabrizicola flagellatus]|uniref:SH3 domain-containing protein n=1 Tax=Tabrizicola flagellatus TaxID=2593021 RepID=UPI0039196472
MDQTLDRPKLPQLLGALAAAFLAAWLLAFPASAQVAPRAEPITGPGVVTIGNIATNARVNVRSGPAAIFPAVGSLPWGTRVNKGLCIGGGSARWCEVTTIDGKISGYVSARFLVEGAATTPDDSTAGGPDYWVVRGLAGNERLGVRVEPRAGATLLATLREGEIVRNLGCRATGSSRWCRIRSTTGMDVTGWVNGRYLRESGAPSRPVVPDDGGPDFYIVRGLAAGDTLNVRTQPSTTGQVIAQLAQGAKVRNLGCQTSGQTRWCRIETTGGVKLTGWVNGRYLREG